MPAAALAFRRVTRTYLRAGGMPHDALHDVSFSIAPGRSVAVIGRSGSGKSTLLHLAAGIDFPTRGAVELMGCDLARLPGSESTRIRRDTVGLVFQFFHLLPHLNALENVLLPAWIAGEGRAAGMEGRARGLLAQVGLEDRTADSVQKLSGGEMQRVAICRALLRRPRVLLADEPTGNLDDDTGRRVMELLLGLAVSQGSTLVYVTHSIELANLADEVLRLHSGRLDAPATGDASGGSSGGASLR